ASHCRGGVIRERARRRTGGGARAAVGGGGAPARRSRIARAAVPAPKPAPSPPLAPAPPSQSQPSLRDWIGVLAMVFGLFMAIMDVQIVTSSLTQIQGGLSASPDEIAWVQTAYLIADVVMVPLSGMLSRMLSTRVL